MISRTVLAVEAMELVKNDSLGARASRPHKAWHNRGYLPHFDEAGTVQFLTFRLMEENPVKAGLVRFAREWRWLGGCLQKEGAGGTPALPGDDNRLLRNQPRRPA